MDSNNLPGLTPLAILGLAVVLAVLLTAGIPIVMAPEPVKVSDWLGFFGALVGAMVTLGAAWIAWNAVQRQITAQANIAGHQFALQSYEILHRLAATLEDELRLALALGAVARRATLIDELRQQSPVGIETAGLLHTQYGRTKGRLVTLREEWEISDINRWRFKKAHNARMQFEGTLVELEGKLETTTALLMMLKDTNRSDAAKTVERQRMLDKISFITVVDKVLAARSEYTSAINLELAGLLPKIDEVQKQANF